ncbi:MAG: folylpolyglutamate synthase/dihydrofolate synthase family protein [Candidatus Cloacimonadota bacterium]|nr:folylpolyglutamate synthase/dihydrofolate synthase family protein [Candidatus Cloacimonadota bacterium]
MNYEEFKEYIYKRNSANIKLGLERIENILDLMDSPNKKLQGIHIGGTNGKGSTCAMCESISIAHNIKTGFNSSPHLIDYSERIRIDRENITYPDLLKMYKKWEEVFESNEASFFEITTSLAFNYFYENKVDNAIFEVGLGGRLDGTNPFQATVAGITTISLDHTKSLGDSIEKIAFEKAGILKKGIPVVIGKMPEIAKQIIRDKALAVKTKVIEFDKDFFIKNISIDDNGTKFDLDCRFESKIYKNLTTNMLGEHQAYNAAMAFIISKLYFENTNKIFNVEKARAGLNDVIWKGRMEIINNSPTIIVDGAHNVEGVHLLVENLKKMFPKKKFKFVLAILRDKHLDEMIGEISTITSKFYISKNQSNRAAEISDQTIVAQKNNAVFQTYETVENALNAAKDEANYDDIIIVTGSLYTISEIL